MAELIKLMGGQFSAQEYIKHIRQFSAEGELTEVNSQDVIAFLQMSSNFVDVFTSCSLEDFRTMKKQNVSNLIHLISTVRLYPSISRHARLCQTLLISHLQWLLVILLLGRPEEPFTF